MTAHRYDDTFFDYIEFGARQSARRAAQGLRTLFEVKSVLDVGCGRGIWLDEWRRQGVTDVTGVDGSYVDVATLAIPLDRFTAADLTRPLDLQRRYDVVQSLEVAEHLPPGASETLVATLVRHGELVMFSAARPGQGGEHHVNERPYEFWRDVFARQGYGMYDAMRPLLDDPSVEPWYRYNTFLFASDRVADRLPDAVRRARVDPAQPVADVAPLFWRLRCAALRRMPRGAVEQLALVKHRTFLQWRRVASTSSR